MKEAIIVILFLGICFFVFKPNVDTKPTIITKVDTIYEQKTYTKYTKGDSIPFIVLSVDSLKYTIHDTITIVKDYLTTKVFTDTFTLDSSKFTIIDTISRNTIQGRRFMADIHEKTIRITNDIYHKDKNTFYMGFLGDLRRFDNNLGIGVSLGFKTAKNDLFTFGATTNQYSVGYYKKLF